EAARDARRKLEGPGRGAHELVPPRGARGAEGRRGRAEMRAHATGEEMIKRAFVWMALPLLAQAQDWPQFRGPEGQGLSKVTAAPVKWSDSSPNVKWKV